MYDKRIFTTDPLRNCQAEIADLTAFDKERTLNILLKWSKNLLAASPRIGIEREIDRRQLQLRRVANVLGCKTETLENMFSYFTQISEDIYHTGLILTSYSTGSFGELTLPDQEKISYNLEAFSFNELRYNFNVLQTPSFLYSSDKNNLRKALADLFCDTTHDDLHSVFHESASKIFSAIEQKFSLESNDIFPIFKHVFMLNNNEFLLRQITLASSAADIKYQEELNYKIGAIVNLAVDSSLNPSEKLTCAYLLCWMIGYIVPARSPFIDSIGDNINYLLRDQKETFYSIMDESLSGVMDEQYKREKPEALREFRKLPIDEMVRQTRMLGKNLDNEFLAFRVLLRKKNLLNNHYQWRGQRLAPPGALVFKD